MPNPLSDRGWSDRDYAAAVGTLVGEAAARGDLRDYQAIADVIANRLDAGVYGKTVSGITMNPREFSTWSPKEKAAFANAKAGFAAAIDPSVTSKFSEAVQERISLAKQAVSDVMLSGVARGLTQGATAYHNPAVTAKLGTGGWHNMLESKYGAVDIGAHTFTGPGFRPDQEFDPITYNGQLAAPPAAPVDLTGVPFNESPLDDWSTRIDAVPIGQVDIASIPDITPQRPATSAGFSLEGATLPADFSMDFSAFDAAPQQTDFSAGLGDGWSVTPDFGAPSLEQRNAETLAQDRINAFESGYVPGFRQNDIDQLNAGLMAELGPQTPAMAPAPVAQSTASFASPSAPMGDYGFDEFGANFPNATPQSVPQATPALQTPTTSLPSATAPTPSRTQAQVAKDFDLPDVSLPSPTMRGVGSTLGLMDPIEKTSFMDAMANPQIAQGWSPGFLDTRMGKATTGAAMGFLTGGPFGAVTSGLWSGLGIGDMIGNELDRYANAYANLTPQDFAAFGLDGNWTDREPTRNTGYEGGSRVGDGSYSDFSGRNENNPQGIL